jgi:hypothetical protein
MSSSWDQSSNDNKKLPAKEHLTPLTKLSAKTPRSAIRCAFCGTSPTGTKDHIPPRGIFPKNRPQLITVPACLRCNQGTSKIEEAFRVYLSLRVGVNNEVTARLWKNEAMRTLRRNPRLRNRILRSTKRFTFETPAGIFLKERTGGFWPPEVHDPIIEKIIRGLYFYHYAEILADRVEVKVQWLRVVEDLETWSRRIDPS